MAISSKKAAQIAREHGLTLSDARALAVLSDTEEEATQLAKDFTAEEEKAKGERIADNILEGRGGA